MNTVIDVYNYNYNKSDDDAPDAWENIKFPQSVPLPAQGEVLYLCADPDALNSTELQPYRVLSREFYIQRDEVTNLPTMRVAMNVERFEEREYS